MLVQFLLWALLFFVVPKNKVPGFKRSLTPDTFSQAAVEMDTIPAGVGSEVFCIVFDAGSTGMPCRHSMHMPTVIQIKGSSYETEDETSRSSILQPSDL